MAAFTQLLYLSSLLGLVYKVSATKQCGAELSVLGMMLQRHIYKKTVAKIGHECLFVCRQENRCQSFNFVISEGICELNNRTKEARPEDYVPNSDRYYFRRDWKRGKFKIVKKKKAVRQLLVNFPKEWRFSEIFAVTLEEVMELSTKQFISFRGSTIRFQDKASTDLERGLCKMW